MTSGGASAVSAGQSGELAAATYLEKELGFRILSRNFRSRVGELDIVALDREELVFVEVKSFQRNSFLKAELAVTPAKAKRLWKTAEYYLLRFPNLRNQVMRFDLILLEDQSIRSHLKNVRLLG